VGSEEDPGTKMPVAAVMVLLGMVEVDVEGGVVERSVDVEVGDLVVLLVVDVG